MGQHAEFWAAITYAGYLLLACSVTIWVAKVLKRCMPQFLNHGDSMDSILTDSMTQLIIIGFYLINFGAISLAMKTSERIYGQIDAIETLSVKLGAVLLVQGVIHFVIVAKLFGMKDSPTNRRPTGRGTVGAMLDNQKGL